LLARMRRFFITHYETGETMQVELNKPFARKLGLMLESRLIWYKHYFLFCDEVIEQMDKPPYWIIDLADKKFLPDAIGIANRYAFSEPFEVSPYAGGDFYIACLYLRYERRELSWASFLNGAGDYTDSTQAGKHDCEHFYYMLNDLEDSEFSIELERQQREQIQQEFKEDIQEARDFYTPFIDYFKRYVSQEQSASR
jgi:hypothetical protein